ncbi:FMN-dependent NADH-azoreductase [Paraburkholderia caffeinitolerans]|uniref:FMN dependent NADH:quinone oxidoreductase n=1 Tax=Paraburkholderia caffeinitolerans TaxID=1723730 RepID=A0A6J5G1P4_9BURK|nr:MULTISPECIES: NAD(P)H-dependent oxidoreductase [Paraburkholderia]CAB3788234.1 FMN-dependent NADH-azoreductase [Paraburkholderia caffeinitolerans]
MNQILHIECSPRGDASVSSQVTRYAVESLLGENPDARVLRRDLGNAPPPHLSAEFVDAMLIAPHARNAAQHDALALSEKLIAELELADVVVMGTPMHNYGAPSGLKAWFDHVMRLGRTFTMTAQGKIGLLRDRPVMVAVSSGGLFTWGGAARQPDYLTGYIRAVFGTIGIRNVEFVTVEGIRNGPEQQAIMLASARRWIDANIVALKRRQPRGI